jgi:CheY-like chemotaxis protein
MKILIVEDDDNKLRALQALVATEFPDLPLAVARSLISGVDLARTTGPDVVLLDMTLPSYDQSAFDDGGGMEPFGGVEFLKQMKRFKLSPSVLIVTQFETFGKDASLKTREQLSEELSKQFPDTYKGMLHYHASLQEWASSLKKFIEEFISKADDV